MDSTNSSENRYMTTPLKSEGNSFMLRQQLISKGSNPYKTPVQQRCSSTTDIKVNSRTKSYASVMIKKMPTYSPPPKNISFVKNPFEHAKFLKERLSQPVCSPSLFKAVSSPAQNEDFTWSIDDISNFRPADIDENPSQDFDSWFSPVTECEAQEAINRFFSSRFVDMESPIKVEVEKKYTKLEKKDSVLCVDMSTQTDITLPVVLPPDLEAILSNFCIFSEQEERTYGLGDVDSNTPSATRKNLPFRLSPLLTPQEKMKTGVHVSTPVTSRLSSPEISPICHTSAMDVSMRDRSCVRLNLSNDIAMCEKETSSNWDSKDCPSPKDVANSCDSAFASM